MVGVRVSLLPLPCQLCLLCLLCLLCQLCQLCQLCLLCQLCQLCLRVVRLLLLRTRMRREETTEEGMRGTTEEERREEETTGTTEEATDMMTGTTEEETTETTEEVTEDTAAEAAATPVTQDIKCTLFVTQFFMPSFFQSLKDTKRRYTQKLRVATGSSFRRRLIHRSYGSAFRSEFSRSAPEVRTNRKTSQRANGVLPPFHENNRKDVIESTEGVTRVLHLCEHTAAVRGRGSLAIQAVCDGFELPLREAA